MPSARRPLARLAFFPVLALAASTFACSSAPPQERVDRGSQAIAVPRCTSTQIQWCNIYDKPNGGVGGSCGCDTWVKPNTDICGALSVAAPSSLPDCTEGVWTGDTTFGQGQEPVWACPSYYDGALPPRIGVVGSQLPVCQPDPGGGTIPLNVPCVEVKWVDSFSTTSCLQPVPDGWGYVVEHEWELACLRGWSGGGGCPGPCAAGATPAL